LSVLNYAPLEALLYALAVSCQFYAAFRLGERRITPRVLGLLAVGLALTAAFASVEYRLLPSVSEISLAVRAKPPLRELPPGWGEGLAAEQRALSIVLARSAYENYGKLIEYVERDGKRVRFSPAEADIENRAKVLAMDMSLENRTELLSAAWRRWLTSTLATLLFGYLIGRLDARSKSAGA
jgi:hypothetical protein